MTITVANGWVPMTTWFSLMVAGTSFFRAEMATIVLPGETDDE